MQPRSAEYLVDFGADIAVPTGGTPGPISLALTRQEYLDQVSDCLKGVRQERFYEFLCSAVYDKMNGTIEACQEYIKNQG